MSKSTTPSDDSEDDDQSLEALYEKHQGAADAMATRDDEIGALARALQRIGGDDDD